MKYIYYIYIYIYIYIYMNLIIVVKANMDIHTDRQTDTPIHNEYGYTYIVKYSVYFRVPPTLRFKPVR